MSDIEKRLNAIEDRLSAIEKGSVGVKKKKVTREPSEYNLFIKSEYEKIKKANPTMNHKDIFAMCASSWKKSKS